VHAYGDWYYYMVMNPVDRIQTLDPAGSRFCRILICLYPAGSGSRSGAPLLSTKTDNLIAEFRATHLQRLNNNDIRQLWASVKPLLGKSREGGSLGEMYGDTFADLDNINEHFAGIATDPNYDPAQITAMKPIISGTTSHYKDITCEYEVYIILAALKKTSPITRV